jgi:hypothetical protein
LLLALLGLKVGPDQGMGLLDDIVIGIGLTNRFEQSMVGSKALDTVL